MRHRGMAAAPGRDGLAWRQMLDKKGTLSKSEAPERLRQHFDRIDANKDGQLDRPELGKAFQAFGRQAREAFASHRAEIGKKMREVREKAAAKWHDHKEEAGRKHGDAAKPHEKKPEEKKPEEKKPENKQDAKRAEEKKG
ncbi:MAG: hypothetical protein HUU20_20690 [Pirellulales bacterium]|nr:hypothetical protein [Pirellulales bacterium]